MSLLSSIKRKTQLDLQIGNNFSNSRSVLTIPAILVKKKLFELQYCRTLLAKIFQFAANPNIYLACEIVYAKMRRMQNIFNFSVSTFDYIKIALKIDFHA